MDNQQTITNKVTNVTYHINLGQKLGQGQYGKVYRATCSPSPNVELDFAVKVIEKSQFLKRCMRQQDREKLINSLRSEIVTWQKSNHPNIVKFVDFIESMDCYYMVSEYCEGPNLEQIIIEKNKIEPEIAIRWFKDLINVVVYLHENNIIHRDIKPANIVFKGNIVKLVDFGFAKQQVEGQAQTIGIGTTKYMAPEQLEGRNDYECNVDIWALGWTFFEVLYGTDPWSIANVTNEGELLDEITQQDLNFKKNDKISENLKELIRGMLQIDPYERFDAEQLRKASELI